MQAATLLHWDTESSTPHQPIIAETSLCACVFTTSINVAGASMTTVCATQLIVAVLWAGYDWKCNNCIRICQACIKNVFHFSS